MWLPEPLPVHPQKPPPGLVRHVTPFTPQRERHSTHRAANFVRVADRGSSTRRSHASDLRAYGTKMGASPHECGLAHTFRAAIISLTRVIPEVSASLIP